MTTDLAPRETTALATVEDALSIDQLVRQVQTIQRAMKEVMHDGEHYGTIPGTDKPTLLKPGGEKLCLLFRLAPAYRTEKTWHDDGHLTVTAICSLTHISTGNLIAEGEGLCTTKEAKYAYRRAQRKCPTCGKETIVKQKEEKGGNFICVGNDKGGCWAKFNKKDPAILNQKTGRVPNEDLPDSYNTVLKMACKRALIAAVLNGTAASDIFTQDIGDEEVEPQKGGDSLGGGASQPPTDVDSTSPPDSSQGSSNGNGTPEDTRRGQRNDASTSPGPTSATRGSVTPANSQEQAPVQDSQGAGVSSWETIANAVDAGLRKRQQVVAVASPIAVKFSIPISDNGIEWDSLKEWPADALAEVVSRLGLTQETLV